FFKNLCPVILFGLIFYLLNKNNLWSLPLSLIYLIYFFIFRQAISFPSPVFADKGITISSGCSCSISAARCKCSSLLPLEILSDLVAMTITGWWKYFT